MYRGENPPSFEPGLYGMEMALALARANTLAAATERTQRPPAAQNSAHAAAMAAAMAIRRAAQIAAAMAGGGAGPGAGPAASQYPQAMSRKQQQREQTRNEPHEMRDRGAINDAAALEVEDIVEDEFRQYDPAKVRIGRPHPDPVVETAALANIVPPDVTYAPSDALSKYAADGRLSSLQLESILYAFQRFDGPRLPQGERGGFFLGDGAGVGKGRQIAGAIAEFRARGGRRVLWVSVSTDLKWDAERDLADLGLSQEVQVYPRGNASLPKTPLRQLVDTGVVFVTYSLLVAKERGGGGSRLDQIVEWLNGDAFGALIVFDEAHKAKNLLPEKEGNGRFGRAKGEDAGSGAGNATAAAAAGKARPGATQAALRVVELQSRLPDARVLYTSATGASKPAHLLYMVRLGRWGFETPDAFVNTITKAGMGAMELFAMGLKAVGCYAARSLSYKGAEFVLTELVIAPELRHQYDNAARFWQLLHRVVASLKYAGVAWKLKAAMVSAYFWGAHMRFFRQVLMAAKVPALAASIKIALREKRCAVVGLQSTGEAATRNALGDSDDAMDDFVSAPQVVLTGLLDKLLGEANTDAASKHHLDALFVQLSAALVEWRADATTKPGTANAAAGPAAADDGDGIVIVGERTAEEVEADRLRRAVMRGDYVDLSAPDGETKAPPTAGTLAKAEADLAAAEEESKRAAKAAKRASAAVAGRGGGAASGVTAGHVSDSEGADTPLGEGPAAGSSGRSSRRRRVSDDDDGGDDSGQNGAAAGGSVYKEATPGRRRSHRAGARAARDYTADPVSDVIDLSQELEDDEEEGEEGDGDEPSHAAAPSPARVVGKKAAAAERRRALEALVNQQQLQKQLQKQVKSEPGSKASAVKVKAEAAAAAPRGSSRGGLKRSRAASVELNSDDDDTESEDDDGDEDAEDDGPGPVGGGDSGEEDDEDDIVVADGRLGDIHRVLLQAVRLLHLPPNPLDHLIELCGGPTKVAEMTGRKEGLVRGDDGLVRKQRRRSDVTRSDINRTERDAFQSGAKKIAIISEAASAGISLQADRRAKNQLRRQHFTLELPWSAEKAIQQFGRSHRSNQSSAPIYELLITEAGGERRFASSAAKRLQSLGALLKGDRRSMGAGEKLSSFDMDNKYGTEALKFVVDSVRSKAPVDAALPVTAPAVPNPPPGPPPCFFTWAGPLMAAVGLGSMDAWGRFSPDKTAYKVDRFLNRLLGLPLKEQDAIFGYFAAAFDAVVTRRKQMGTFDGGIVNVNAESITLLPGFPSTLHTDDVSGAETRLVKLRMDRGVPLESASKKLAEQVARNAASAAAAAAPGAAAAAPLAAKPVASFYISRQFRYVETHGHPLMLLVLEIPSRATGRAVSRVCKIYRPNNCHAGTMARSDLELNYDPCTEAVAKPHWNYWFSETASRCIHGDRCKTRAALGHCNTGMRFSALALVTGAVLPVWKHITSVVGRARAGISEKAEPLRVARVTLDDGTAFTGLSLNEDHQESEKLIASLNGEGGDAGAAGGAGMDEYEELEGMLY